VSAPRPVDPAFIERLHQEWLAATGGMSDEMADAVARALLPAQRRLDTDFLKRGRAA
jgi:hypothetical protein